MVLEPRLLLAFLFFVIRAGGNIALGGAKYYLMFLPISYVFIITFLNKRKILLHMVLSFVVIGILSSPFYLNAFGSSNVESEINNDMSQIISDFDPGQIAFLNGIVPFYLFYKSGPEIIKNEEYQLFLENKSYFVEYEIIPEYRINLYKQLELKASLKRDLTHDFGDIYYIISKEKSKSCEQKEGYSFLKGYEILCVYEK